MSAGVAVAACQTLGARLVREHLQHQNTHSSSSWKLLLGTHIVEKHDITVLTRAHKAPQAGWPLRAQPAWSAFAARVTACCHALRQCGCPAAASLTLAEREPYLPVPDFGQTSCGFLGDSDSLARLRAYAHYQQRR